MAGPSCHTGTRSAERFAQEKIPQFLLHKKQKVARYATLQARCQERNLRDVQMKHYHMSTVHFKKAHLDILGKIMTSINTWRRHARSAIPQNRDRKDLA